MSSLYLHIPYCLRKCGYCDFFSQVPGSAAELNDYVQLLQRELALLSQQGPLPLLETVFFGGGTPSLLSAEQIGELLCQLQACFGFAADCEISLEANPGSLTAEKLAGYQSAGVNRLSLGAQSFSDAQLQRLGRRHSAQQARQAVSLARAAGFSNLSLDLIFALPDQSLQQLSEDVAAVLELQPEHLSIYGLTIETQTPLYAQLQAGKLIEADEQFYHDSYLLIDQQLTTAGFEHYEISNFARPGFRCRHNQNYWRRRSCHALGCGAHSFYAAGWGERWHVPADLSIYRQYLLAGEPAAQLLERFDRRAAMAETIYLALRTADGLSRQSFRQQFGCYPEQEFADVFSRHKDRLTLIDDCWRFDVRDWLLYDHLISAFL